MLTGTPFIAPKKICAAQSMGKKQCASAGAESAFESKEATRVADAGQTIPRPITSQLGDIWEVPAPLTDEETEAQKGAVTYLL